MKNERGAIKLIAAIRILLVLIVILFICVVLIKFNNKDNQNIAANDNVTSNSIVQEQNLNVVDENTVIPQIVQNIDNNTFDFSFLKLENNEKNMIYSPLSIKYALKMLQEGANGNSLSQIEKVTGNLNLTNYKNIDKVLSLANGLFIRDSFYPNVRPEYNSILASKYNAEILQDRFENANNINKWIENKTLGIIKKMLKDETVANETTKMILVNALAIDMEWQNEFQVKDTHGKSFYKADGTEIQATTMGKETSEDSYSYYVGKDVTAVSMNLKEYEGTQMDFIAIMPSSDLKNYIENLSLDKINNVINNLKPASSAKAGIDINIPKFSFDCDLKLKQDLMGLGITDVFKPELADFTKMANIDKTLEKLYVSDALHKANIDFTEKGVKAAAVTAFIMTANAMIPDEVQPIRVNFDKPFLFLIRDKKTKEIWFVGAVYEPNLWENDRAEYQARY